MATVTNIITGKIHKVAYTAANAIAATVPGTRAGRNSR